VLLCVSANAEVPSWEELLDALDAVSPLIDDARPGLAFADMRGSSGDPAEWMRRARKAIAPFVLDARLGVGSNKTCARTAALLGDGTICPAGGERSFLAPLSLEFLEIDPKVVERLRLLGIERMGDLARLPHGPFVRRFGPEAAIWHACASGRDPAQLVPRAHSVAIEASMFGEGRADDEAQVIFALRVLLSRICSDLEQCGKRAGSLQLDVELEDAQTQCFDVLLASPTIRERDMLDIVRAKLEGVRFESPIVGLRLRAARLEEGGEKIALFADGDFDLQAIAVAISRLEAMLGEPVRRARTRSAHVLEERFAYDPFRPALRACSYELPNGQAVGAPLVPQLRLMAVTEIDVRVRNGEPAAVASDAKPPRAVVECSGPWRVEIGWFSDAYVVRDEYDVLLEDGELYRIYRQGAQWYLRGNYD
jgi:protein ImuB